MPPKPGGGGIFQAHMPAFPFPDAPPLFRDDELQRVAVPVLYLAGQKHVLLPAQKSADRLQRLVPEVTTCLLGEEGHGVIDTASFVLSYLVRDQGAAVHSAEGGIMRDVL